jgi:rubrerythrin
MTSLKGTKTAANLMHSFAGESQARNRYTYYASVALKEGYVQISNIFTETAENEMAHAKKVYKYLNEELSGETIEITAEFPILLSDTKANLKASAGGENEEYKIMYPEFAKIAEEEGFKAIAHTFREIAEVEERHEARFLKLLANIENNQVFQKDEAVEWKCNNCGYIHEGKSAPVKCPACDHPQAHFEVFKETY